MRSHLQVRVSLAGCGALLTLAATAFAIQTPQAFETSPEPDYRALFKLLMTAAGEEIDSETHAWHHFLLFQSPEDRAQCTTLGEQLGNEISRRRIIEQAQAAFRKELTAAAGWPGSATFRLKNVERLGEYDFERGVFPLQRSLSGVSVVSPTAQVGMALLDSMAGKPGYYAGPTPPRSCVWLATPTLDSRRFGAPMMTQLALTIHGGERLREVPVSRGDAEALVKGPRGKARQIDVELIVRVDPPDPPFASSYFRFPAWVLAARALNPDTGAVIHTYDSSLFSK